MTVRAIVGARVSSVQGDEKTSHLSQRSKGQAYAESQGWSVVGAFQDLDVSAIEMSPWERPDLKGWLTERVNDWDALIFAKTDRVFRSAADCVELAEWCKDHRKLLVLIDDGIKLDYFNPEDTKDAFAGAMSRVFLILASVFAEIEGQRFVQRARDRVAYLRNTDRWGYGVPPFGFKIVDHLTGTGKALDLDVDAQKVLHRVGERLLAGGSLTGIAADLNTNNVLSPADWHRARSGNPTKGTRWTVNKLRMILSNPTTQGIKTARTGQNVKPVLDVNGELVRVGPASFDPDTWQRIQSELTQRTTEPRKRRHSTNPLLGVAKCGSCGKNMRQRSQTTPAGVTHRYYVCGASPRACPKVSIIADHAEDVMEEQFLYVHADRRIKTRLWRDGSDHSTELEQTNQTIEALRHDRVLGLFSTPDDERVFRQQMQMLIAKRDELSALPIVQAGWIDVETNQTYAQLWPTASVDERRAMLSDAGMKLTVYRPNMVDIYSDYDRVLGDGLVGRELAEEEERQAAARRAAEGIKE